ncbi:MAG: ATP-binding protein [Bacteroidales bacterium]
MNDSLLLFRAMNRYAAMYEIKSDYTNSIAYYIEADKIAQNLGIYRFIIAIKLNLGALYLKLGRNQNALEQFLAAKYMKDTATNVHPLHRIVVPLNLGAAYSELNMIDSAIYYSKKSLSYALEQNNIDHISINYSNIGNYFYKIDKLDSAIFYGEKAYEIRKQNNDLIGECNSLIGLILDNKETSDYGKARYYEKELEDIITQVEDKELIQRANYYTAILNADLGNFKKAFPKLMYAYELNDSLLNERKQNQILDLETKYQTQQKENEILCLNNENQLKKAELAQSRLLNISGLTLLIVLGGIAFFFWQRKKQQLKVALLENSIQATELEKRRIGKELHDGIAGTLIKLVKDVEQKDLKLSDQLLGTYNEVRKLSHQLDNSPLHGEVFMDRLIDLVPQDSQDQHFSFKITPLSLELSEPVGTHLYRIIQELIANNIKHAKATKTKFVISWEKGNLYLNYEDNGIGIGEIKKGNGFKNIESRLELMKGTIQWPAKLSPGLKIEIQIPYHYHEKD